MALSKRKPLPGSPRRWRPTRQKALALLLGCLVAFCLLEAFFRFWNPLSLRIKGDRISLPVNQHMVLANHQIAKLDPQIVHTRNSLGLRGDDPPADFDRWLSIFTVGGSTTECFYLSDDKTWPERLRQRLGEKFTRVWVNNAGLDGHSTFGHRFLLANYLAPLQPKVIIYLVGINDVGSEEWNGIESLVPRWLGPEAGVWRHAWRGVVEASAVFATLDAALRYREAKRRGLTHGDIGHEQLALGASRGTEVSEAARLETLARHREKHVPGYQQRLRELVRATRGYRIEPILVTQPALYGPAIDDVTKVDLGRIGVLDSNGQVQWEVLELYNDATRRIGREESVFVVDLARGFPKSSRYYYDFYHFTNEGADLVGKLLCDQLSPLLARRFPDHLRAIAPGAP